MKKLIIFLVMMLFCFSVANADFLGIKQASETIKFPLNQPLDSAFGIPRLPDSFHIITYLDNASDLSYSNRSTTYPFLVGVDTTKIYGDTLYWFEDQIQDIDGAGGYGLLSISCAFWYDDIPTYTFATVQIVSDSLENFLDIPKDSLNALVTSRLAPTTAGRTLDIAATGEAGIDLDNTTGTLSNSEVDDVDVNVVSVTSNAIDLADFNGATTWWYMNTDSVLIKNLAQISAQFSDSVATNDTTGMTPDGSFGELLEIAGDSSAFINIADIYARLDTAFFRLEVGSVAQNIWTITKYNDDCDTVFVISTNDTLFAKVFWHVSRQPGWRPDSIVTTQWP